MSRSALPLSLATLAVLAACSRTPPEPSPASTTNGPAITADKASPRAASPAAAGARCIAATPIDAPPVVTAVTGPECPPDPDGIPKLKVAQVAFPDATGNPKVEVELVTTEQDIQRGLMYRHSMPEEHGMLFRLLERREQTFWMRNTCMPLDMLFVDDDGTVVGIVESATPLTDTSRTVKCPSSWVLEVNAGWCRRHGVKAGQKMGIPPAAR